MLQIYHLYHYKWYKIYYKVVLFLKSITDDLSENNIEKIFNGIDTSGDRQIDLREFKGGFMWVLCAGNHKNLPGHDEENN